LSHVKVFYRIVS